MPGRKETRKKENKRSVSGGKTSFSDGGERAHSTGKSRAGIQLLYLSTLVSSLLNVIVTNNPESQWVTINSRGLFLPHVTFWFLDK